MNRVESSLAAFCGLMLVTSVAVARPNQDIPQLTSFETDVDVVGDVDATPAPSTVLQDTVWIADWTFDAAGGGCTNAGWAVWDNRILNVHNDADFWHVDSRFADQGGVMVNRAAIFSKHDLCWGQDGYGNDNDFSIVLAYRGASATLRFDKASDSEPGFDFITVETDSLGLSEARADPNVDPRAVPEQFRHVLFTDDGFDSGSSVGPLTLTAYGVGTHEVYIRFEADGGYSDEDGLYPTALGAGLIVDNIVVTGDIAYSENFEGALGPNVQLVETASSLGLSGAPWWRVLSHLTDNDKCTENLTCAWIDSDPLRPAFMPSMNFGPGQAVIRNWLDDIMASPWVSLTTPGAMGTLLSFRLFPANPLNTSDIVLSWRVRAKVKLDNTDSPAPGDSIDCVSPWGHASSVIQLTSFQWTTSINRISTFLPTTANAVQVSFRVVDRQHLAGASPPVTLNPGPGPYIDRVRIGRHVLSGPEISEGIDSRLQAQDAFPTVRDQSIVPGEHFVPDGANRFGTCAFSEGTDLGIGTVSPRLITGDSILLERVLDTRGAGGIASVRFYGAIVSGPHEGKAPGPYTTVGGFFQVNADSARSTNGVVVANRWFVDLDDSYFRGGDALKYFWAAVDNGGGFTSTPVGLTSLPGSVAEAEAATGGLHEVDYLPVIDWDPGYVAAVAAHGTGDVEPTQAQIDNSTQRNCVLYYQHLNTRRRSGPLNRTSFMHTLDILGYAGDYDVYDVQGGGNSVNQLAGRANVPQCSGYALIIQDDGRSNVLPSVPAGENNDGNELDQAGWYQSYLAQGASGLAGTASLWLISENSAFYFQGNAPPLFPVNFGLTNVVDDQGLTVNPNVRGVAANTWANGSSADFTGDEFALEGGCPLRRFDMASSTAGSTITHRYAFGMATSTGGAIVMNRDADLEWNTVWQGFAWQDIRFTGVPSSPTPQQVLLNKVLAATVPAGCLSADPTTDPGPDPTAGAPAVTALHPNVPNPFNPATRIAFDLAIAGRVQLRVYDVAGKLVRTLVDADRAAGRYTETWTGLDTGGARVASGVYFYRLDAPSFSSTRKMVLLQ